MSKSPDDLLAFNDFENFGESPEISVNSPKKVTFNDGDDKFEDFHCLLNSDDDFKYFRSNASRTDEGFDVSD